MTKGFNIEHFIKSQIGSQRAEKIKLIRHRRSIRTNRQLNDMARSKKMFANTRYILEVETKLKVYEDLANKLGIGL